MRTLLKASRPAELISILPSLAGFTPRRSLVIVPFCDGRSHGVIRIDLPAPGVDPSAYAAEVTGLVCRVAGVDAVVLCCYTDETLTDALPHASLLTSLADRLALCGIGLIEALCVGVETWADYRDPDGERHPLWTVPDAPPVPGIGDVSGDQSSGAGLPSVDAPTRAGVAEALACVSGVLDRKAAPRSAAATGLRENPLAVEAAAALDDLPAFLEGLLDGRPPGAHEAATLAWCLDRPLFRDAAFVQWARDAAAGQAALAAQLACRDAGIPAGGSLGEVLLGRGRHPDPDRLTLALSLVRWLAACLPGSAAPRVAAGWLSWALGRTGHAGDHIRAALALDPEHEMAQLIDTMLRTGMLPEWVFG